MVQKPEVRKRCDRRSYRSSGSDNFDDRNEERALLDTIRMTSLKPL